MLSPFGTEANRTSGRANFPRQGDGLSPRTVEKRLHGAYAKLGVSAAWEAASTAWAAVGVRLPS